MTTQQQIEIKIAELQAQIAAWNLIESTLGSIHGGNPTEDRLEGLIRVNEEEIERLKNLLRQS